MKFLCSWPIDCRWLQCNVRLLCRKLKVAIDVRWWRIFERLGTRESGFSVFFDGSLAGRGNVIEVRLYERDLWSLWRFRFTARLALDGRERKARGVSLIPVDPTFGLLSSSWIGFEFMVYVNYWVLKNSLFIMLWKMRLEGKSIGYYWHTTIIHETLPWV